jgi:predicted PurR-regulated permease PerM
MIDPMSNPDTSTQWKRESKLLVTVIGLLTLVALAYVARGVIPLIVLAAVFAYIFQPAVGWLTRHRVSRGLGTALCLLLLVIVLALLPVLLTPATVNGVSAIIDALLLLPDLVEKWTTEIAQSQPTLRLGGFALDLAAIMEQVQTSSEEAIGQFQLPSLDSMFEYVTTGLRTASGIVQTAVGIASSVVSAAFRTFLLAVLIFFLTKDGWQVGGKINELILPPYRAEIEELGRRLDAVWKSFFRGQILLSLVVGFIVFIATSLLGLPGALVLGLLAGVLEVIPNLGPVIALIPAVLVALVQGSNFLPVSNLAFALIVVLVYTLIQQIENNFLVPRIMGQSLKLHPIFVLVGVVVGASFAGILGAFLAAPVLASLKVLGIYAHAKLIDQDPLVQPSVIVDIDPAANALESPWSRLKRWFDQRRNSGQPALDDAELKLDAARDTPPPAASTEEDGER